MTQGNPVSTANRIHPNQSIFDRIRIATNCYAVKDQKGTHTGNWIKISCREGLFVLESKL